MNKMEEGPIKEASYFYPAKRINDFLRKLPETDMAGPIYANIVDKIVVMTHDDEIDYDMVKTEESLGITSTFFLLPNKLGTHACMHDLQLHFNKEHSILKEQVNSFLNLYGYNPTSCRIHKLFWRADNFDFPLLALNGFLIDSSKIGITPYKPCIGGKLLPIWEVPFALCDVSTNNSLMAIYNVAKNTETLFKQGISPIVVNAHPKRVAKVHMMHSCYDEVINCLSKYDYDCLNLTEFYRKYLAKQ